MRCDSKLNGREITSYNPKITDNAGKFKKAGTFGGDPCTQGNCGGDWAIDGLQVMVLEPSEIWQQIWVPRWLENRICTMLINFLKITQESEPSSTIDVYPSKEKNAENDPWRGSCHAKKCDLEIFDLPLEFISYAIFL